MNLTSGASIQTTPHFSGHTHQAPASLESSATIKQQPSANNTPITQSAFNQNGDSEIHIREKRQKDRLELSANKDIQSSKEITENNNGAESTNHSSKLTSQEKKEVDQLKKRDEEVRRHEQAHYRAAGKYAQGGPQYTYEVGPDGKQYAVEGKVGISLSKVSGDPEATLEKARQVRKSALAPQDPSDQDRRVAAEAQKMEAEARQEISQKKQAEASQQRYHQNGNTSSLAPTSGNIDILA